MKTFEVISSHGTLTVDCKSGRVLDCYVREDDEDSRILKSIRYFAIIEWRAYYRKALVSTIDILDLGYWFDVYDKDGTLRACLYEGPVQDWRNEFRRYQIEQLVN